MRKEAPTRHQRRKLRTRRLLLNTTETMLIDRGYDALTVQDIADRADVARGTFYVHFKDKEEAIWAIVQGRFEDLAIPSAPELPSVDPSLRHYEIWRGIFSYAADNRVLLRVLLGEQGHMGLARRIQSHLADVLERSLTNADVGPIPDVPDDFKTQYLVGALVQTMTWWLRHPGRYTIDDMTRQFYVLTLRRQPPLSVAR